MIAYTKQEIAVREEQAEALKGYIAQVQAEIAAKEATMAKNKKSSKSYKQAATDLEALNEELVDLIEAYAEAETGVVELTDALAELREEQRQTRISVEEMIREVLEAEEEAQREMLEGRQDVENEILEILEERYEKQKDLEIEALEAAIEAAEARQEAIDAEIDALDEALEKRRELADAAKEEQELAEMEARYARISVDPTRAREAMELYKEIQEKREEMAWDSAEAEVESQKEALQKESEAIDGEIEDIEKQMDEIEEAFEELMENPQKLIEEMLEIMKLTDAEIIQWLQTNSAEFAKSTQTSQTLMVQGWQDTLDQMRGNTAKYEEQIREILTWTDAEILQWMQTHSVDFKTATEAQQQSFLHGWKTTLKDWRDAYKEIVDEVIELTGKVPTKLPGTGGGSGGGGGSSGGGGGSTTTTVKTTATPKGKQFEQNGTGSGTATIATASRYVSDGTAYIKDKTQTYWYRLADAEQSKDGKTWIWYNDKRYVKKYAQGGLVDYTGPAWLDGTRSRPERVLDWRQNMLFENLVKTLEKMQNFKVSIPSFEMPAFGDVVKNSGDGGFNIEQINVTVEKLESDTDYEAMADQIGKVIERRLTKGKAIGGIRIK